MAEQRHENFYEDQEQRRLERRNEELARAQDFSRFKELEAIHRSTPEDQPIRTDFKPDIKEILNEKSPPVDDKPAAFTNIAELSAILEGNAFGKRSDAPFDIAEMAKEAIDQTKED